MFFSVTFNATISTNFVACLTWASFEAHRTKYILITLCDYKVFIFK